MDARTLLQGRLGGFWRTLAVASVCLLAFLLFHESLASYARRGLALLALASLLSIALGYELHVRGLSSARVMLWVLASFALAGAAWPVWNYFSPAPPVYSGPLLAAGERAPAAPCAAQGNDLALIADTACTIGKGEGPFTPVLRPRCPAISFTRNGGGLFINGFGYGEGGEISYRLQDNGFQPQRKSALHEVRPDPSTYMLLGAFDREVLYVRFLNRNAVQIHCGDVRKKRRVPS